MELIQLSVMKHITSVEGRKQTPKHAHKHQEKKKRVRVFTSCPTRYRMNLFLAYSLSFIMQPLIEENKRGTYKTDRLSQNENLETLYKFDSSKKGCGLLYPVFALIDHLGTE